jgi:hypothetical protein
MKELEIRTLQHVGDSASLRKVGALHAMKALGKRGGIAPDLS